MHPTSGRELVTAKTTAKRKKWFIDLCENGYQIYGTKVLHLSSNGLRV